MTIGLCQRKNARANAPCVSCTSHLLTRPLPRDKAVSGGADGSCCFTFALSPPSLRLLKLFLRDCLGFPERTINNTAVNLATFQYTIQ